MICPTIASGHLEVTKGSIWGYLAVTLWVRQSMRGHCVKQPAWICHLALSGLTVRLPAWPCQQVRLTVVRTGGGASNMNIYYDVTGLLTVVWRSHSGQIVWAGWIAQGGGGFWTHSVISGLPVADNRIDEDGICMCRSLVGLQYTVQDDCIQLK